MSILHRPRLWRGRLPAAAPEPPAGPRPRRWASDDLAKSSARRETLIYPEAPTTEHWDLPSFAHYAKRAGLDVDSSVYKGTLYEYAVAASLARYGFSLKRIGGASDFGTDLIGTWTPPTALLTIKVLLQCKAGARRAGPQHVRELEGAFVGAPPGWRGERVLAFLVSESAATKGVRDALGRSRWPMGFACCSRDGVVLQMLWNRRAEEEALEGFQAVVRRSADGEPARIALARSDRILPLLDEPPTR